MNKKAGSPLAILLLTIGVIIVMIAAWFIFLTKEDFKQIQTQSPDILDEIYSKESEINFYISQIMQTSTENLVPVTKTQFLNNFKEEFKKQNLEQLLPELKTVEPQLIESNVNIQNNEATLTLKFKIERTGEVKGRDVATIEYIYEKEFTAKII